VVWGEYVDHRALTAVTMGHTLRARKVLREAGLSKDVVRMTEHSRLDAKIDDEVHIVGGANVGGPALYLVKEHHLPADQ
jgi:hypothetical protein